MAKKYNYDFGGYVTKNNLRCSDGRIIKKDAFSSNDGMTVPLVWQHNHTTPSAVLGHAVLENREDGVYAYCSFNDTQTAKDAKEALMHGDIDALSIWANNIKQIASDVIHGAIKEVSLVLAGANPGAFVESIIAHGISMDEEEDQGILYTGENIVIGSTIVSHADKPDDDKPKKEKSPEDKKNEGESLQEVYDSMTDIQKRAVAAIVSEIIGNNDDDKPDNNDDNISHSEGMEENDMPYKIFEQQGESPATVSVLSHDDMKEIFKSARKLGTFRSALDEFKENSGLILSHASIPTTGMDTGTGKQSYGISNPDLLLPDYKAVSDVPDFISRDMDWVAKVMSKVKNVPFSRIKTLHADITEDEARAKGYIKGKLKKEEVFTLLKRTTDPQTIYKKQKLDKDDLYDIEDFDMAMWLKGEMDVMLNEEQARAILIGDGRASDSEDKIKSDHIRPIASDVDLYNTKIEIANGSTTEEQARNFINQVIKSRKKYKGSGNPDLYTTEDMVTDMLLIENKIGEKVYKTLGELATTLRVGEIIPVEPMEDSTINGKSILGVLVNLNDYSVGHSRKSSETDVFEGFDIDYNQFKYLKERRISGALTKPFSAVTFISAPSKSSEGESNSNTTPQG